ncbi:MAG: SDR family NAD(P)-dependent oxidoreductase [Streptosporangiales bacterium]|nr:SDR family NAD(P)-dependent oxidoreductase [Streptosporangiales bacterium]
MTKEDPKRQRTWLITGTSSGVGYATAKAALEHGDLVAATARDTSAVRQLTGAFPGRALALQLDVRDEEGTRTAVSRTVEEFGGIDVVFNNAGYALVGPVEGTSDRQARDLFDTGFFGGLNVLRAALPVLRGQRSGHVLQMSSIFGQMSFPATGMLAAVKQAMGGATQAMAAELAPLGIRFTQLEPGGISTGFLAKWTLAAHDIPDYAETAGATLDSLKDLPPEAVADVSRVAAAILKVAGTDKPPMRLALGGWAEGMIRQEIAGRSADLDNWSRLTRSVDPS